ncbi:MAG: polysaccharide biosynthesis C-terminal domain-containing protein, partial [Anaerolineae bacterium]|nr:polysaccharide biosynthesis C-terminal domain-containing protein [Anaerolineae bacterium]
VRAFYALHDTWTPVRVGTATMLLNIALSLVLIRAFGYPDSTEFARGPFGGLALAMSVATAMETAWLWVLLRRRVGGMEDRRVLSSAARTLAASLVMAGAIALFLELLPDLALLFRASGAVIAGAAVFWIAALALRIEQARALPRLVLRRGRG